MYNSSLYAYTTSQPAEILLGLTKIPMTPPCYMKNRKCSGLGSMLLLSVKTKTKMLQILSMFWFLKVHECESDFGSEWESSFHFHGTGFNSKQVSNCLRL